MHNCQTIACLLELCLTREQTKQIAKQLYSTIAQNDSSAFCYLHLFSSLFCSPSLLFAIFFQLFFCFPHATTLFFAPLLEFATQFTIFSLRFIFHPSFSLLLYLVFPRRATHTQTIHSHAVCRDFPNYLPFALSPPQFRSCCSLSSP